MPRENKMKKLVLGVLLAFAVVTPVSARQMHPFVEVVDSFDEGSWATQPIDAIWGNPVHVLYSGSEVALFTCPGWTQRVILTSESGPGVSVDVYPAIAYVPATYTVCHVDLLGKKDRVLASDTFTIYSPV